MKRETHPHADALDRIGQKRVMAHFNIGRTTASNWRVRGVPKMYIRSLNVLAAVNGISVPELKEPEA